MVRLTRGDHTSRSCVHFRLRRLRRTRLTRKRRRRLRRRTRVLDRTRRVGTKLCQIRRSFTSSRKKLLSCLGSDLGALGGLREICRPTGRLTRHVRDTCVRLGSVSRRMSSRNRSVRFGPAELSRIGSHLGVVCSLRRGRHIRALRRLVTLARRCHNGLSSVASCSRHVTRLARHGRRRCGRIGRRTRILAGTHTTTTHRMRGRLTTQLMPLKVPGIHFRIRVKLGGRPKLRKRSAIDFLFSTGGGNILRGVSSITSKNRVTHIVLSVGTVVTKTIGLPAVMFSRVSAKMSNRVTSHVTSVVRRVNRRGHRIVDVARLPRVTTQKKTRCGMCGGSDSARAGDRVQHLASRRQMRRVTRVLDNTALARTTLDGTGTLLTHG